jgi:ribosomal protein L18
MPGKIFYRERRKVDEGEKKPRFNVVAIADLNLKIQVKHFRKQELEQLAEAVGAELVEMVVEEKGHKQQAAEQQ